MKRLLLFLCLAISIAGCRDSSVDPITPAARRIYFTPSVDSARNLYIASIEADGSDLRRVLDGAVLMDAPAGGWLVAALSTDVFSTRSARTTGADIHDFGRAGVPHLTPSGRSILFADRNRTTRSAVNGGAITTIDTGDCPCSIRFTHDERFMLYASHGELRVLELATKRKWALVAADAAIEHRGHAWSPDGTRVAFLIDSLGTGSRTLFIADRDGGNRHAVRALARGMRDPGLDWSPDGSTIAVSDGYGIALVAPDGTGYRLLVDGTGSQTSYNGLQWGPDGRALLYTAITTSSGYQLSVVAVATGVVTRLHDDVVTGYWER